MDRPLTETAYQRANRDLWAVRYAKTFSDEVKKHTRATFGHGAPGFFFGMWPEGIMPPVFEEIKDEPQHSQAIFLMNFFYTFIFDMIDRWVPDWDCTDNRYGHPALRVLRIIEYLMSDAFLRPPRLWFTPLTAADLDSMINYQCEVYGPDGNAAQFTNIRKFALSLWNASYDGIPKKCLSTLSFLKSASELLKENSEMRPVIWPIIYWATLPHGEFRANGKNAVHTGTLSECLSILNVQKKALLSTENELDREKFAVIQRALKWDVKKTAGVKRALELEEE
ncbi:hypothetical protein E8E14_008201 [Neopestalotiopsis sp. 37M]|nr:hypothetical protein E8E14_008201 [Neopestalotiopsis sp. 37M]